MLRTLQGQTTNKNQVLKSHLTDSGKISPTMSQLIGPKLTCNAMLPSALPAISATLNVRVLLPCYQRNHHSISTVHAFTSSTIIKAQARHRSNTSRKLQPRRSWVAPHDEAHAGPMQLQAIPGAVPPRRHHQQLGQSGGSKLLTKSR